MLRLLTNAMVVAVTLGSTAIFAQGYPSKPVRIINGTAGGATDLVTRVFAAELSTILGQQFVVESRPGAGNSVAGWAVKNSAPDGYTLFGGSAIVFHALNLKDNFMDASKDLQPVSTMVLGDTFLMSRTDLGVNSFKEFVAKAKSTRLKFASPSPNTQSLMAVVAKLLGFQYDYIPYKLTSQAVASLLSGECDFTANALAGQAPFIESGKIRVIGNFGPKRSPLQPNVPTMKEEGADIQINFDLSLWAPLGTPRDVVAKLGAAVAQAVKAPAVVEKIGGLAMVPVASTPEELGRLYLSEVATYKLASEVSGIKPQ